MSVLDISNLCVHYGFRGGSIRALDGVSVKMGHGETLGVVGESGCGKSTLGLAIMRLLPKNALVSGSVSLKGINLFDLDDDEVRKFRWKDISMIFQGSMNALNPVLKIGDQLTEALLTHERVSKELSVKRAEEVLELVGLPSARISSYPHELSGGMKQRVVIAMSLMCNPRLIIADEPTTALDVIVQDQVIGEIYNLQQRLHFSLILISHDVSIIAETCDRVVVMYGGKIVESGPTASVFSNPGHPYTRALLDSTPSISGPRSHLTSIPGSTPTLTEDIKGCTFAPRCKFREDICSNDRSPLKNIEYDGRYALCHFAFNFKANEIKD